MIANGKIALIGAGNMARSLIGGLLEAGVAKENLHASNHNAEKVALLNKQFGIPATKDNRAAADGARVVILTAKPKTIGFILDEIGDILTSQKPLIISVATGVTTAALELMLGQHLAIVRAMPNIAVMANAGATGLYANGLVSQSERDIAESIFRSVGLAVWLEHEKQLEIITGLSGSGPAYFFYFMEAMEHAAVDMGLPQEMARLLTIQTALGAGKLALEQGEEPAVLRQRVTSPNGTTQAAINYLEDCDVFLQIEHAVQAACARARAIEIEIVENLSKKN